MKIAVLPGDGIGPEIIAEAVRVLQLLDERFELEFADVGGAEHAFDIAPFRKYCLLNDFDDIGLTLRHADRIRQFEAQRLARFPWLEKPAAG